MLGGTSKNPRTQGDERRPALRIVSGRLCRRPLPAKLPPMRARSLLLVLLLGSAPALAEAPPSPPPPKTVQEAILQLGAASDQGLVAALKNLTTACRGSLRLSARDDPALGARLLELAKTGSVEVRKGVMDAGRCVRPAAFVALLEIELAAPEAAVRAYAAEGAARVDDPAVVPALLSALDKCKTACKTEELAPEEVEVCVWLTYAPGAVLGRADRDSRERVAKAAAEMLEAPHPKVREVAVETLAAAKLKVYAAPVAALIQRETRAGGFKKANDRALISRFEARVAALKKGD